MVVQFFVDRKNVQNLLLQNKDIDKYRNNATAGIGNAEYNVLHFRDQHAKIFIYRKYPLCSNFFGV